MKILAIGDIVGAPGREVVINNLDKIKREHSIDLVIANGENAAHGFSITEKVVNILFSAGIDVLTMGNHTFDKKEAYELLRDNSLNIIRPCNYSYDMPGRGSIVVTAKNGVKIGIINALGKVFSTIPVECPFAAVKNEVEKIKNEARIIIVDFHAEATSEKKAFGFYLDGKVSGIFGTHTHVMTADEVVLPNGTGYITDVGMTGPENSVLGMDKGVAIERFVTGNNTRLVLSKNEAILSSAVFDIDEETGNAVDVYRLSV